jgi:CRP/FNR family transcriptional regulator
MNPQIPAALRRNLDDFVLASGLPTAIIEELIGHHTVVTYPKGSTLFLHGSPADMFFCVFSGMVEVYCPQSDGSRVLVRLAGPGEILGHVDFIDHKGRRAQVFEARARGKCEVALITREHVGKLLQTLAPAQLIGLLECVNTMWSAAANGWATFIGLNYRERLGLVLRDLASRFGVADSRGTIVLTELLHAKLAEMIGSSRPIITRLINEMVAEGVLERHGKQYILLNPPDAPPAPARKAEALPLPSQALFAPRGAALVPPSRSTRLGGSGSVTYPSRA